MAEFSLIEVIRERCAVMRDDVRLGIGDDGAVLAVPADHELVVSTDTLVAGVHFPSLTAPFDIGWKALAVNLSDLAAMGATPAWALLALTMPSADMAWIEKFADGFAALACEHRLALVGGDTTRGPLSITITVFGVAPAGAAITRSGAQPGDWVCVTGTLGDAAAGLACVQARDDSAHELIGRLNRPVPRIAAGLLLRNVASAAIDISDGLLADLGHICVRSGVGAELCVDDLPMSAAFAEYADASTRQRLQLAGGDDYELCFSVAPDDAPALLWDLAQSGCAATRIGQIVVGHEIILSDDSGARIEMPQRGWEHFV